MCEISLFQLKDLRSVADQEVIDHTHFAMLLKSLEAALIESVRILCCMQLLIAENIFVYS